MRHINAFLVTTGIVFTVSAFATLQPVSTITPDTTQQIANINKDNKTMLAERDINTTAEQSVKISGITQYLAIDNVLELWQVFNQHKDLQSKLTKQPNKVYVVYSDFSNNYETASITIGYDVKALSGFQNVIEINQENSTLLLKNKKHTAQALSDAWQNIDYRHTINQVVEVHTLSSKNTIVSSELFVSYIGG